MNKYPPHLTRVVDALKKFPGVGSRSAERFAFDLLDWTPEQLTELASLISEIPRQIQHCQTCGCLRGKEKCSFCDAPRDTQVMCVLSSAKEVFSIEETGEFRGLYHVLGGTLNPLEGKGPESLNLASLRHRLEEHQVRELVIALDSSLEGDATALYLKQELQDLELTISRIAFGLPMGSALDYVDGGTLARALSGRHHF